MGSFFGLYSKTEEVPYSVVETVHNLEIRQYQNRLVIETLVRSSRLTETEGFHTLASFIFGKNKEHKKIAMTSPVEVRENDRCAAGSGPGDALLGKLGSSGMIMRFNLPQDLKEDEIPTPLDVNINISKADVQLIAVVRFTGAWDESAFQERAQGLLADLQTTMYRQIGPISSFRYDPPWTLTCFRRNEIAVPVLLID